jgi:hypothetical protein
LPKIVRQVSGVRTACAVGRKDVKLARSRFVEHGRRPIWLAAIVATIGLAASVGATAAAASSPGPSRSAGATPSSYRFDHPIAIAAAGGNLWIANYAGNSVTETTSSGAWIRTIAGAKYGFRQPDAIASYRDDVFIVNHGGSVTEMNSHTAALIRIISGRRYEFASPTAAVEHGGDIFVVNTAGGAVTEFNASTGTPVRILGGVRYGFDAPDAIAVAGADLWVTNRTGGSVTDPNAGTTTEFVASTGAFVRRVSASADGLERPSGIAFDGTHLWISDAATDAVTELSANGALVRTVSNASLDRNYGFNAPTAVVASGTDIYVISPPGASPMVTQITASTAEGNWYECNTNTPSPNFDNPTDLVVTGGHVWVVSPRNNTLTELSVALGGTRVHLFT